MDTDWEQVASILAVVGAALVVVKFLWRKVPKLYNKLRHNMFGIGDLKVDMKALSEQMQFVVSEFAPNGGASIKDSLNRIELRQVRQEQRQKAIFSDMSVGVFETDDEGEYNWVNRKYLRMTGRAPDEVKGSGWVNTVAARDRERVILAWNEAVAEGREFEEEYLMITPDNKRVQVQVRTYKMSTEDHKSLGFMGFVTPLCEEGRKL